MTAGTNYEVVWPDGDIYANRNGEIRLSAAEARATAQAIGGTWRHATTPAAGTEVSDQEMSDLEERCLTRHAFHGDWNYALLAIRRPGARAAAPPRDARPLQPAGPQPPRPHRHQRRSAGRPGRRPRRPVPRPARAGALRPPRRPPPRPRPRRRRAQQARPDRPPARRPHPRPPAPARPRHRRAPRRRPQHRRQRHHPRRQAPQRHPPPPAAPPPGIPLKTLADLNEYAAGHGITLDCAPGTAHTPATMTR